jgi:glycosyltransferase involved in cell wall biosynthesis
MICPRTKLGCFDLLIPRESRLLQIVGPWLRRCDRLFLIRTGDIATVIKRFGVPSEKCVFIPFPGNPAVQPVEGTEEAYVYSSGTAYRDWPTLVAALSSLPYPAIISTTALVDVPSAAKNRVRIIPLLSPDDGRMLMAKARVVVVSILDTDFPAGPLVLLDAMAMKKAIVATTVKGTLDYTVHGETALMVPPGNVAAMAKAIDELMKDVALRKQLSSAAATVVTQRFTLHKSIDHIISAMNNLNGTVRAARAQFEK